MATVRWIGAAQDIPEIYEFTFSDTWAQGDTITFYINNKGITLTVGSTTDNTTMAAMCAAMFNARSAAATKVSATRDETYNFGGQEIAEFTEVTATSAGAVLTIKSLPGVPVDITFLESTDPVTGGTITNSAHSDATGRHFADNADNWDTGALPDDGDTILFDSGSVDVRYGLDGISTEIGVTDLNLVRLNEYTGNIGLKPTNPLGYPEYRQRYLTLYPATGGAGTFAHVIGSRSKAAAKGWTYIDLTDITPATTASVTVVDAPQRSGNDDYAVQLIRGPIVTLAAEKGSVLTGGLGQDTYPGIYKCYISGTADVKLAENTILLSTSALEVSGGTVLCKCGVSVTYDMNIYGGEVYVDKPTGAAIMALDEINIYGGHVYLAGSAATCRIYKGGTLHEWPTLQYQAVTDSGKVSAAIIYSGGAIDNQRGLLSFATSGIDFVGCTPQDCNLKLPPHKTWTQTAI